MINQENLYIGTKQVTARPMTRKEYNDYRGWELPSNEDGSDKGYLVEYMDGGKSNHPDHTGYISWSPSDVFDRAYRRADSLTFGEAVEALKLGLRLTRKGWNGKDMFVWYVPKGNYPVRMDAIKGEFEGDIAPYREYLALKTADGDVSTWAPSISDVLAEDWLVV